MLIIERISRPSAEFSSTRLRPLTSKKFGAELFLQLIYLLGQCLGRLAVFFAVELRNEIKDLAIGLGLCLVTTDEADEVSCVRLQLGSIRLLTLRKRRHRSSK